MLPLHSFLLFGFDGEDALSVGHDCSAYSQLEAHEQSPMQGDAAEIEFETHDGVSANLCCPRQAYKPRGRRFWLVSYVPLARRNRRIAT